MSNIKSEEEWRKILDKNTYHVLREKGTEHPFKGKYFKHFENGTYRCAGCQTSLYSSKAKFKCGCGWGAFYEGLPGAIKRQPDSDGHRVEILCSACEGHIGHVFTGEGYGTPTDERHCVNSLSLKFEKGK